MTDRSDTLSDRIAHAGARAMGCGHAECQTPTSRVCLFVSPADHARACLSAALAVAEAEGVVLTRVPGEAVNQRGTPLEEVRVIGHNACRAATLAGKVTL